MRIPDPTKVDPAHLARTLRLAAENTIRVDGDRDHMNSSLLTVDQSVAAAAVMLVAADKIDQMRDAIEGLLAPLGPGGYHPAAGLQATEKARASLSHENQS